MMKKGLLTLMACCMLGTVLHADAAATDVLVDALYEQNGGNVVVSELSVNMALALLLEGADGSTREQLEEYLGCTAEECRKQAEEILSKASASASVTLNIANSIWYENAMEISPDYEQIVTDSYLAELCAIDFSDSAAAAETINSWCEEATNGLIPEIVVEDSLSDAVSVLANALYFSSMWREVFTETQTDTFYGYEEEYDILMMTGAGTYYCETDAATAFIKYYNDGYAFVGILPKKEGEFDLADFDLDELLATKTDDYEVEIGLPEFSVDYSADLCAVLPELGLTDIFTSEADLTGVSEDLYVSSLLHKTSITVDAEGTEAAAATAATMLTGSITVEEKEVKTVYLNRPFAFATVDMDSNTVLFMGKITEPDEVTEE
ncbi:MAG: hypothetical protein LUI39_05325 [Lachnospiraceae bacterium]|nr:hypothetical protein [Lachnospiraceae bacterium]